MQRPVSRLRFLSSTSNNGSVETWISKVGRLGANALLGMFTCTDGFDSKMKGLSIDKIEQGYVKCSMEVTKETANSYGTLHGGCSATLVDIVGTMAILTHDPTRPGVSVEINTSYISSAKIGERIIIEGRALKVGKQLGFTSVDIKTIEGKIICTGRHVKALGKSSL